MKKCIKIKGSQFGSDLIKEIEFPIMDEKEMLSTFHAYGVPIKIEKQDGKTHYIFGYVRCYEE